MQLGLIKLASSALSLPENFDSMEIVAGIDPGKRGGLAFIDRHSEHLIAVHSTPQSGGKVLDTETRKLLILYHTKHVVIEHVWAMPKQGVTSSFNFGESYGILKGICIGLQIPYYTTAPAAWRKAVGLKSGMDKGESINCAQNIFPYLSDHLKEDGPAEAALIALAGIRRLL